MKKYTSIIQIILGISLLFCVGCQTNDKIRLNSNYQKNYYNSSFNNETYVWEDFNFTTNKIERK